MANPYSVFSDDSQGETDEETTGTNLPSALQESHASLRKTIKGKDSTSKVGATMPGSLNISVSTEKKMKNKVEGSWEKKKKKKRRETFWVAEGHDIIPPSQPTNQSVGDFAVPAVPSVLKTRKKKRGETVVGVAMPDSIFPSTVKQPAGEGMSTKTTPPIPGAFKKTKKAKRKSDSTISVDVKAGGDCAQQQLSVARTERSSLPDVAQKFELENSDMDSRGDKAVKRKKRKLYTRSDNFLNLSKKMRREETTPERKTEETLLSYADQGLSKPGSENSEKTECAVKARNLDNPVVQQSTTPGNISLTTVDSQSSWSVNEHSTHGKKQQHMKKTARPVLTPEEYEKTVKALNHLDVPVELSEDNDIPEGDVSSSNESNVTISDKFQCDTCKKDFSSASNLGVHRSFAHGFELFDYQNSPSVGFSHKCSICAKSFGSKLALAKHKKIHIGTQSSSGSIRKSRSVLENQMEATTPENMTFQSESSFSTQSQPSTTVLNATVQDDSSDILQPSQVEEIVLQSHEGNCASLPANISQQDTTKDDDNEANTEVQNELSSPKNKYQCEHCSDSFSMRKELKRHKKVHKHSGDSDVTLGDTLNEVDTSHYEESAVENHENVYQCQMCETSFSRKKDLKKHTKSHQVSEEPFFVDNSSLVSTEGHSVNETLSQESVSVYQCTLCPESFVKKKHLKRHSIAHKATVSSVIDGQADVSVILQSVPLGQAHETSNGTNRQPDVSITAEVLDDHNVMASSNWSKVGDQSADELSFTQGTIGSDCSTQKTELKLHEVHEVSVNSVTGNSVDDVVQITTIVPTVGAYQCSMCLESFERKKELRRHSKIHKVAADESMSTNLSTLEHVSHTQSQDELEKHSRMHEIVSGSAGIVDNLSTSALVSDVQSSVEHNTLETSKAGYQCSVCSESFSRKKELRRHSKVHEMTAETGVFDNRSPLVHVSSTQLPTEVGKCSQALEIAAAALDNLSLTPANETGRLVQEESHTETFETVYQCEICAETFERRKHLKRHRKIHVVTEDTNEQDGESSLMQIDNSQQNEIKSVETNEKVYLCEVCAEIFDSKRKLRHHRKTHEDSENEIEDTGTHSLIQTDVLSQDNTVEEPEHVYHCNLCTESFSDKKELKKHKKAHKAVHAGEPENEEKSDQCNDVAEISEGQDSAPVDNKIVRASKDRIKSASATVDGAETENIEITNSTESSATVRRNSESLISEATSRNQDPNAPKRQNKEQLFSAAVAPEMRTGQSIEVKVNTTGARDSDVNMFSDKTSEIPTNDGDVRRNIDKQLNKLSSIIEAKGEEDNNASPILTTQSDGGNEFSHNVKSGGAWNKGRETASVRGSGTKNEAVKPRGQLAVNNGSTTGKLTVLNSIWAENEDEMSDGTLASIPLITDVQRARSEESGNSSVKDRYSCSPERRSRRLSNRRPVSGNLSVAKPKGSFEGKPQDSAQGGGENIEYFVNDTEPHNESDEKTTNQDSMHVIPDSVPDPDLSPVIEYQFHPRRRRESGVSEYFVHDTEQCGEVHNKNVKNSADQDSSNVVPDSVPNPELSPVISYQFHPRRRRLSDVTVIPDSQQECNAEVDSGRQSCGKRLDDSESDLEWMEPKPITSTDTVFPTRKVYSRSSLRSAKKERPKFVPVETGYVADSDFLSDVDVDKLLEETHVANITARTQALDISVHDLSFEITSKLRTDGDKSAKELEETLIVDRTLSRPDLSEDETLIVHRSRKKHLTKSTVRVSEPKPQILTDSRPRRETSASASTAQNDQLLGTPTKELYVVLKDVRTTPSSEKRNSKISTSPVIPVLTGTTRKSDASGSSNNISQDVSSVQPNEHPCRGKNTSPIVQGISPNVGKSSAWKVNKNSNEKLQSVGSDEKQGQERRTPALTPGSSPTGRKGSGEASTSPTPSNSNTETRDQLIKSATKRLFVVLEDVLHTPSKENRTPEANTPTVVPGTPSTGNRSLAKRAILSVSGSPSKGSNRDVLDVPAVPLDERNVENISPKKKSRKDVYTSSKSDEKQMSTPARTDVSKKLSARRSLKDGALPPGAKRVQCDVCHGGFSSGSNLSVHKWLKHRSSSTERSKCDVCGVTFTSEEEAREHMCLSDDIGKLYSMSESEDVNDGALTEDSYHPTDSEIEPESSVPGNVYSANLLAKRTGNGRTGPNKSDRRKVQTGSPFKVENLLKCEICNRVYHMKHFFEKHMKAHKSHQCLLCHATFCNDHELRKHQESHVIESDTAVEEDASGDHSVLRGKKRKLPKSTELASGEKVAKRKPLALPQAQQWQCNNCGRQFKEMKYLKVHWDRFCVSLLKCGECGKIFKSKEDLQKHTCEKSSLRKIDSCPPVDAQGKNHGKKRVEHTASTTNDRRKPSTRNRGKATSSNENLGADESGTNSDKNGRVPACNASPQEILPGPSDSKGKAQSKETSLGDSTLGDNRSELENEEISLNLKKRDEIYGKNSNPNSSAVTVHGDDVEADGHGVPGDTSEDGSSDGETDDNIAPRVEEMKTRKGGKKSGSPKKNFDKKKHHSETDGQAEDEKTPGRNSGEDENEEDLVMNRKGRESSLTEDENDQNSTSDNKGEESGENSSVSDENSDDKMHRHETESNFGDERENSTENDVSQDDKEENSTAVKRRENYKKRTLRSGQDENEDSSTTEKKRWKIRRIGKNIKSDEKQKVQAKSSGHSVHANPNPEDTSKNKKLLKIVMRADEEGRRSRRSHLRCEECDLTYGREKELALHQEWHRIATERDALQNIKVPVHGYTEEAVTGRYNRSCKSKTSGEVVKQNVSGVKDFKEELEESNSCTLKAGKLETKSKHQCEKCQKSFKDKSSLAQHIRTHDENYDPNQCVTCGQKCYNRKTLRRHRKTHKATHPDTRPYECKDCGQKFKKKDNLKDHMTIHSETRQHKCQSKSKSKSIDGAVRRKKPKSKGVVKDSKDGVKDGESYECYICRKSFSSEKRLFSHMKRHNKERYPFECEKCGKTYRKEKNLEKHKKKHSGKRFGCDKCDKSFFRVDVLNQHLKVHEDGDNPTKCQKEFEKSSQLNRHKLTHSDDRPLFKCDECTNVYSRKDSLVRHKRKHVTSTQVNVGNGSNEAEVNGLREKRSEEQKANTSKAKDDLVKEGSNKARDEDGSKKKKKKEKKTKEHGKKGKNNKKIDKKTARNKEKVEKGGNVDLKKKSTKIECAEKEKEATAEEKKKPVDKKSGSEKKETRGDKKKAVKGNEETRNVNDKTVKKQEIIAGDERKVVKEESKEREEEGNQNPEEDIQKKTIKVNEATEGVTEVDSDSSDSDFESVDSKISIDQKVSAHKEVSSCDNKESKAVFTPRSSVPYNKVQCEKCGTILTKSRLVTHKISITCSVMAKAKARKAKTSKGTISLDGDKKLEEHICKVCDKSFSHSLTLDKHMQVHKDKNVLAKFN